MGVDRTTAWEERNQRITTCERCPPLRAHCKKIAVEKRRSFASWDYWGLPVPDFGAPAARLLITGLAPAAHGANRTGRMFTGDRSGEWLFRALHKAGFASQPEAESRDDGLQLIDCCITAVCHCAPPDNKPTREEIDNCQPFLAGAFAAPQMRAVLALGGIAWKGAVDELIRCGWWEGRRPTFSHACSYELPGGRKLFGSYHPSQQNTFTGRLTEPMFDEVFAAIRRHLAHDPG